MRKGKDLPMKLSPKGNPLHLVVIEAVHENDNYFGKQTGILAGVADAEQHCAVVFLPITDRNATAFDVADIVRRGL